MTRVGRLRDLEEWVRAGCESAEEPEELRPVQESKETERTGTRKDSFSPLVETSYWEPPEQTSKETDLSPHETVLGESLPQDSRVLSVTTPGQGQNYSSRTCRDDSAVGGPEG